MSYRTSWGRLVLCMVACLAVGALAARARAEVISFSLEIGNILYQGDCESIFEEPEEGPSSLIFRPVVFQAVSDYGSELSDSVDGALQLTITPLNDAEIGTIVISELVHYVLDGDLMLATQASIYAEMSIAKVLVIVSGHSVDVDYVPQVVFQRTAHLGPDETISAIQELVWTLDVPGALAEAGIEGRAMRVEIALDNYLRASSQEASCARIKKKWLEIKVIIPEPSAMVLLICGCSMLGALRRRRR